MADYQATKPDLVQMPCPACNGTGIVPEQVCCRKAYYECLGPGCTGAEVEQQTCPTCEGTGAVEIVDEP
jgi:DnaJ-class molecular chaperone